MNYYNRYKQLRIDNENFEMPRVLIPISSTDKVISYKQNQTHFHQLSEDYYGNALHGFLIMCANPHITDMEYDIENGTAIRIPFPFERALTLYNEALKEYILLEGLR